MANDTITLPDDSLNGGKKVDNESLVVGGVTAFRQRMQIAGDSAADIAIVMASDPAGTEAGLVTRNVPSGTQPVSAATLPLPTGAASETSTAAIDTKLGARLPAALGPAGGVKVEVVDTAMATLGTDTYTEATTKGIVVGAVRSDADVSLANTDNEVTPLQVNAAGQLKVEAFSGEVLPVSLSSLPALAAGSAAIGKLAANSGVDIGDVDVTSLPALVAGTANIGLVQPAPVAVRIQVTPTGSTSPAYTAGDSVGGLQTITGAARVSGGSGIIQSIIVHDKSSLRSSIDLVFFDRSVTVAADNAALATSDADNLFCLGVIPIGPYQTAWAGNLNSVSTLVNVGLPFVCNGSADLFLAIAIRSAHTFASTDQFSFTFIILQD